MTTGSGRGTSVQRSTTASSAARGGGNSSNVSSASSTASNSSSRAPNLNLNYSPHHHPKPCDFKPKYIYDMI